MGPCVAYCLCSRVGSVAVAVPAPTICFAPLSIVTACCGRWGGVCVAHSFYGVSARLGVSEVWDP